MNSPPTSGGEKDEVIEVEGEHQYERVVSMKEKKKKTNLEEFKEILTHVLPLFGNSSSSVITKPNITVVRLKFAVTFVTLIAYIIFLAFITIHF